MTHSSDTSDDGTRSEVAETDGPVAGADAVPDKTSGTAAKGSSFDDDDTDEGDDRADTSVRDQD